MRDLFSPPDPYAALVFSQDPTQGALSQTAKERLEHMVAAYSRAFVLTGPNVQFLRHMLDRGNLDAMARSTMRSEWAENFAPGMGRHYRSECDYTAPLRAAVDAAGTWPWVPDT